MERYSEEKSGIERKTLRKAEQEEKKYVRVLERYTETREYSGKQRKLLFSSYANQIDSNLITVFIG